MKRTPLPAHDFPDEPNQDGDRPCQTEGCTTVWKAAYDDPPPWGCVRSKLRRTGSLDRSTPLSPVSDNNSEGVVTDTSLSDWIRDQPCMLSEQPGHYCEEDVVAHHVRSRGSGHGDWRVTNDGRIVGNLVPLDYFEHQRLHDVGRRTWEQKHGVDLEHAARRYGEEFSGEPPQRVRDRAQIREAKDGKR